MKFKILVFIIASVLIFSCNIIAQGMNQHKKQFEKQVHQQLNLTEEQQTKVDELKFTHQKEIIDLKADLEKKELDLTQLKSKGNYTRDEYLNKVDEIISARNKIALCIANHQMDVYQLLDDNQKKEWNKISGDFGERKHKRIKKMMKDVDVKVE